jgi:hypothetical protein
MAAKRASAHQAKTREKMEALFKKRIGLGRDQLGLRALMRSVMGMGMS